MIHKNNSEMATCAQICLECARACGEAINACLDTKHTLIDRELFECLIDCMTICQTSSSLLMRGSPNHIISCEAVAKITEICAQNCERFDEPALQYCAEECRGGAASCRSMIDDDD